MATELALLVIFIFFFILFGPPLYLIILGSRSKNYPKKANTYYIFAIVYLIIGTGICGSLFGVI